MAATKRRVPGASAATTAKPEVEEEVADVEEQEEDEEGEEKDEDEEDGEYEVDGILDHKQESGRAKFLVSWKGYGAEHNTWEPEENLNAPDLLKQYWSNAPKREATKKPTKGSASTGTTTKRKSTAAPTSSNKRQRGSVAASDAVQEPEQAFDEDHEYLKSHVDDTTLYDNEPSWEELVKSIQTVERTEDGQLMAYMTMTGGEKIAVETTVCRERLPQMMLEFYESHLKWKSIEDD